MANSQPHQIAQTNAEVAAVLAKVQSMYAKNKAVSKIIESSTVDVRKWTAKDGLPLEDNTIIRDLTGLPCIPFNKIIQSAGKPDTGKSTSGAQLTVAANKNGWKVVYWDTEEKMDAHRLTKMGAAPESFYPIKTNEILVGGQLLKDYVNVIMSTDPTSKILINVDSIGGGVSRSAGEVNRIQKKNAQPGQEAKEWGQVTRDIVSLMNKYRDQIAVYVANQTYAKIGFMQKGDKAKGGDGIEFHSSLIIFTKRLKVLTHTVDKRSMKKGIITQMTVTKNHLTQADESIYQMNFEINAAGSKISDFSFTKAEDSEDDDSEE